MKCIKCGYDPDEINGNIISDYLGVSVVDKVTDEKTNNTPVAVPKVYDYRERFKLNQIRLSDIKAPDKIIPNLQRQDNELDNFRDNSGEKLFFGGGLEQEL
jgi:hypothetical protein